MITTNLFIEAFKMDGSLNPNNFVLFDGEDLSDHPYVDFLTTRNAQIAEISSLKKQILTSRDIIRVDKAKEDYILVQISSSSFEMKIRLIEEVTDFSTT